MKLISYSFQCELYVGIIIKEKIYSISSLLKKLKAIITLILIIFMMMFMGI